MWRNIPSSSPMAWDPNDSPTSPFRSIRRTSDYTHVRSTAGHAAAADEFGRVPQEKEGTAGCGALKVAGNLAPQHCRLSPSHSGDRRSETRASLMPLLSHCKHSTWVRSVLQHGTQMRSRITLPNASAIGQIAPARAQRVRSRFDQGCPPAAIPARGRQTHVEHKAGVEAHGGPD
mgnify:FL=1